MVHKRDLAAEIDNLRKDVLALREKPGGEERPHLASAIASEIGELRTLVEDMLNDAETGLTEHPVATVAGALALGILIGRLTAR